MKQQAEFEDEYEVEDVPVSPLLAGDRKSRYGSVPGLDDEELADPWELEKQAILADWGPILALPVRTGRGWIQPRLDEDFGVDFGAFGTVRSVAAIIGDEEHYTRAVIWSKVSPQILAACPTWRTLPPPPRDLSSGHRNRMLAHRQRQGPSRPLSTPAANGR